jgi:hypothetical protein
VCKNHIGMILERTGMGTRLELALWYWRNARTTAPQVLGRQIVLRLCKRPDRDAVPARVADFLHPHLAPRLAAHCSLFCGRQLYLGRFRRDSAQSFGLDFLHLRG